MPRTLKISDGEIREALSEPIRLIVQAVRDALERVPPELSADIFDRGVVLTGGGALLRNLDKRLRDETGLPVLVAENPLTSVVLGRRQDADGSGAAEEESRSTSSFAQTSCAAFVTHQTRQSVPARSGHVLPIRPRSELSSNVRFPIRRSLHLSEGQFGTTGSDYHLGHDGSFFCPHGTGSHG